MSNDRAGTFSPLDLPAFTDTGLGRITNAIKADTGLATSISASEIATGADKVAQLNQLIIDGLKASSGWAEGKAVTVADVVALSGWVRTDAARLARFTDLHGDDEKGVETGYHLVQNDGANTTYFAKNLVNTVADGLYHIGFQIKDGRFLNEDGNANAKVSDVADWLTYFLGDASTTGTGLDRIVDTIKADTGLARWTSAADINAGATIANDLNKLVLQAVAATNAMTDGWITSTDLQAMNTWLRADPARYARFLELHGDDENGVETGYHLVQNDGASTTLFGRNLINGPADSIYHFGFDIQDGRFVNEDGDANASLSDVAAWLNYFIKGSTLVVGSDTASVLTGTAGQDHIMGMWNADTIDAGAGDDLIEAGWGADVIKGGAGNDQIFAQGGDDKLDGGEGSDRYMVSGNLPVGWSNFGGHDTYADTGTSGTDTVVALGTGDVDIGVTGWDSGTGIEVINATGATGTVRLLGDSSANTLNLSTTTLTGANIVIDGGHGNDTITGNAAANTIVGAGGNDKLDGGNGGDTYRVTGNQAGGWSSFNGFDTYADTGTSGSDRIVISGKDVDLGLRSFSAASSGIEVIDASAATGTTRIVGDWSADSIDLRGVSVLGSGIVVDGAGGNDTLIGATGNDSMRGGSGNDLLVGGAGQDSLDGGDGNDLLLATQGSGSGRELYIGGAGSDRIALALNDRSALDLRGGSATAADGTADTFTLVGTRGALSFTASVLDFEVGKDRLDFSQLRDSGNNVLGMEDLVISASGGHTQISFAAGVHAVGGGAVDVQLTLMGVGSVAASSFSFTAPSLGWGVGTLETAFAYL